MPMHLVDIVAPVVVAIMIAALAPPLPARSPATMERVKSRAVPAVPPPAAPGPRHAGRATHRRGKSVFAVHA